MRRLTGTAALTRAALQRDRVLVGGWVSVLTLVVYASAAATAGLYPSEADRATAARALNASGAVVALYGPILDVHSLGELAMTKLTVLYAVVVALLFVVLVRRHTRGDEESGHAELLGGTGIGQDALLAAAVAEAAAVAVLVGALAAGADLVGGLPTTGSLLFGASWTGAGLVAIGLTAVACQLSASSRTCAGIAGGAIALLYAVRAVGDVGPHALSWLSPFGWSTQLRAWDDPRWWVLLLYPALAACLVAAARVLRGHRDLGSGILPARPGPSEGTPRLANALALGWRVHRVAVAAWSVAVVVMGGVFGAIAPGMKDLLDRDRAKRMLEAIGGAGALEDALLSAVLALSAVVVTCFGLTVVTRASSDEHDGRTEQVLATAVPRARAFVATVTVAALGSAWLVALTGLATGLGLGRDAGTLAGAGLAQVPAVWVVLGLTVLLAAVRSAWAVLGWAVLVAFVVVGQLGELLSLPDWITGMSPYAHTATMPSEPFDPVSALALTAVAAVLTGAAWWRYRERDIG